MYPATFKDASLYRFSSERVHTRSAMETHFSFTPLIIQALLDLILALVLGAAIGFERQIRKQPAGLHTNALVCMGSAAYVLVALRTGDGPHRLNVMGWYEDELRQEQGRWCLRRRIIRDWNGPVLARIAGQDGTRQVRPLPPPLTGLWATQS